MTPLNDDTAVLHPVAETDPAQDGLAVELAKAAPRKWWNKVTIGLGAAVLLCGGFVGGLQVQKNYGTSETTAARPGGTGGRGNFTGGYPGGNFGGANAGGGQNAGGGGMPGAAAPGASAAAGSGSGAATTGKVKLVDGTTLYVETSDGDVVTIKTGDDTTVQSATTSKLKDLKAGDSVSVQGSAGTDGTVTATTVTKGK